MFFHRATGRLEGFCPGKQSLKTRPVGEEDIQRRAREGSAALGVFLLSNRYYKTSLTWINPGHNLGKVKPSNHRSSCVDGVELVPCLVDCFDTRRLGNFGYARAGIRWAHRT